MSRLWAAPIEAGRLRLDPLRQEDAEEMAGVLADPRLHGFTGGQPDDLEQLRQRYRRLLAGPPAAAESWLNWIVRDGSATAVGTVQATVLDRPGGPRATVAWVIGVPWQGRGHGSAAAAAMVAWLRAQGVVRVAAHIHPGHRASERVAERCGLAPTGRRVGGERVWQLVLRPGGSLRIRRANTEAGADGGSPDTGNAGTTAGTARRRSAAAGRQEISGTGG